MVKIKVAVLNSFLPSLLLDSSKDYIEIAGFKLCIDDIILLCYEEPGEFCHRRLVADYLELMTGIYIPEISIDDSGNITRINPKRYKDRLKKIIYKNDIK